jgi:hypothetical protein
VIKSLRSPSFSSKNGVLGRLICSRTRALLGGSIPHLAKTDLIFDSVKALLNTGLKSPQNKAFKVVTFPIES